MELAFCSVCLHRHSLDDMLRIASGCGYTALELIAIPTWIHVDLSNIESNTLQANIKEHGMKLIALYPGGVDTSSDAAIEKCVAYIRKTIDVAAELGVQRLVFTGSERDDRLDAAIEAYQSLVPALEKSGITLCLENHYKNQLEFPEDYERVFDKIDSPNIGMTIDTGHYTSSKVDVFDLIDRFGQRIGHVHLKDHIGTKSVAIGSGKTDNAGILKRLYSVGYRGYISLELEVEDYDHIEHYVAEAKEIIEGYITDARG
ncbi:MAG: sugar phosphate isomerase/epimerase family protein [bacterium]